MRVLFQKKILIMAYSMLRIRSTCPQKSVVYLQSSRNWLNSSVRFWLSFLKTELSSRNRMFGNGGKTLCALSSGGSVRSSHVFVRDRDLGLRQVNRNQKFQREIRK